MQHVCNPHRLSYVAARMSLVACALVCLCTAGHALAYDPPPNDGFVTDAAGILDDADEALIEEDLKQYRDETSNEITVLIVRSLSGASIAEVAVDVGRKWGVGSEQDNGILLLISYADREVFLATGYGLEGAVPDLVAKGIIDEEIIPAMRDGAYAQGISQAIDALKKHIGGEYSADRYSGSDGDGPWPFLLFFIFIVFDALAALLGRSKSWWAGGIVGGVAGVVLLLFFGWWVSIPLLVAIGLALDYVVSRIGYGRNRGGRGPRGPRGPGGMFGGGRGGGGGFGGFGGGSFGGGGASGRW